MILSSMHRFLADVNKIRLCKRKTAIHPLQLQAELPPNARPIPILAPSRYSDGIGNRDRKP